MRVLHLSSSFPRHADDATAPYLLDLARAEADAGIDVHVLAPHDAGAAVHELIGPVAVHRFRYAPAAWERAAYRGGLPAAARDPRRAGLLPPLLAAFTTSARRSVRRLEPDVVHAHWWLPAGVAGVAGVAGLAAARTAASRRESGARTPISRREAARAAAALVVTLHGSDVRLAARSRSLARVAHACLVRADAVTAVSDALADEAAACIGIERGLIDTTRMPVPTAVGGAPLPLPPSPPLRLVAAGRLTPEKGFDVLVDAVVLLAREGVDVELDLVGDGPEAARLDALARPAAARIRRLPPLPRARLAALFDAAHAVVVPSRREGLGLVAVDALARQRPVIASRVGGLPETVADGEDGLLVAPDDPDALAAALRKLPLPTPTGRALARHEPAALARAHLDLYERVVRGRR